MALTRSGGLLYLSVLPPALRWQAPPAETQAAMPMLAALTGGDAALQQQLQRAARLVDSPINLLIHGETGSGKEFLAKALHLASARRGGPFVAVNCAAIPETLIESELFGHLPNSFSGAGPRGKRGLIQEPTAARCSWTRSATCRASCSRGCCACWPRREVLPVGAARPVPVRLRVISATHHGLEQLVADGRFREDLYYRLNGARFTLPPLRERTDLDWLIRKLLREGSAQGSETTLSPAARERMHRHRWPGNLRELRNVLEYARAVCADGYIDVQDLPDSLAGPAPSAALQQPAPPCSGAPADPHPLPPEGMLLMQYLRASGWNLSAVARQIGVSRMTLYRRMERYGIQSPNRRDGGPEPTDA